jgi:hypothetical protein
MKDKMSARSTSSASLARQGGTQEKLHAHGYFTAICIGADGKERWRCEFSNLVTTVGKNDLLDSYLKGSSYTQTMRMGLKGTGTVDATDTQASHPGWLEVGLANDPTYTGNRKSVTFDAAVAGSSASPAQSFAITSSGTVAGCFINNGGSATIDDTTGVLFSAGNFTGGNRSVLDGDTINVTYTLSV